mgnify:CR=1 FL=1
MNRSNPGNGPVRIVAIGAGNRTNKYLEYAVRHPERLQLAGVVELNPLRREAVTANSDSRRRNASTTTVSSSGSPGRPMPC